MNSVPELHYVSGRAVYCEQFAGSKLIGKYWSANGLIENGREFPGLGLDVPCQAFALNLDGQSLDWGWEFVTASASERDGKWQSAIELTHSVRPVKLKIHTEVDGTAFLARWLEVTNTAARPRRRPDLSPDHGQQCERGEGDGLRIAAAGTQRAAARRAIVRAIGAAVALSGLESF